MTSPIQIYLEEIYKRYAGVTEGAVADYIPELAKAEPNSFGICLVTATGSVYEVGDSQQLFTIQSISKPFVYGLALEDNGRQTVLSKVGMEPTGDAFNSISLDPESGRPRNPMINAGAIATTGLVEGKTLEGRFNRILDTFSRYAGRALSMDELVYRSESETGHRNRAISHMLRNFDILTGDPAPALDLYFRQCSIAVTCRDLGIMAATLANSGVNPVTGRQALRGEYVESVLSVMGSCGMYDYAGSWIYQVGMPAKSGVAGGIIAVLPGQLGIGVFSPPLDQKGNSVRGIGVCDELSRHLNLHLFNRPTFAQSTVRASHSGAQRSSSRIRTETEARLLHKAGDCTRVYQLQGNLSFVTTEVVVTRILSEEQPPKHIILDLRRVLSMNESSCRLLYELLEGLTREKVNLIFTHAERFPLLRRLMKAKLKRRFDRLFKAFEDNDLALEWCEDQILDGAVASSETRGPVELARYDLLRGLSTREIREIEGVLQRRCYDKGAVVVRAGDTPTYLYLVAQGRASVILPGIHGARKRLATFTAGMAFGEMAFVDQAPRSATVIADTELVCDHLDIDAFAALGEREPGIKIKLLKNICLELSHKLRKTNRELSLFE
jgi:glutaminase